MRRLLLSLLGIIVSITFVNADKVTEQQALQKARQFVSEKQFPSAKAKARGDIELKIQTQVEEGYYIFNIENNGGFVIVSRDDRMRDVLGYSERGSLKSETAPCNVKWLLNYYNKVAKNITGQRNMTRAQETTSLPAISPLISTIWAQGEPYNDLCPMYKGDRCITGCVATSMAQVINYNRWPQGLTGSVEAYTSPSLEIYMPQLEPTQFDWDNMANDDIARLMLYCGQAVKMDYGVGESGAVPIMIAPALTNVFGYSQAAHEVERASYSDEEWELLLYNELAEGRPIIYEGRGTGGGHSFILHGYSDGRFYVNWGWAGAEDGFFALTGLYTGIGDFNSDQSATVSVQPPTGNTVDRPKVVVKEVYYGGSRYVSRGVDGSFSGINLSSRLVSDLSESASIFVGLGLYDSKGLQQVLFEEEHIFPVSMEYQQDIMFEIGSDIADGTYRVVPICHATETDNWLSDANASDYYLEIKIDGDWMRLRTFLLNLEERSIDDVGVTTVDGLAYAVYNQYDRGRASIISFGSDKPNGVLNIPQKVPYKSKDYYVKKVEAGLFNDCPDLTSLSLSTTCLPYISNCPNLSEIELREGVCLMSGIAGCNNLESIEFPKSLSTIEQSVEWCSNLKSVRFNNPRKFFFNFYPQWGSESMPALKDVYFASPEPPVFRWTTGEFTVNANTTIHVPEGAKADYESAGWKGWTIVEDQPVPAVNGIEWGYCDGNEVSDYTIFDECGDNDGEYAIHVPAEMLLPYKGMKISHIQFYQPVEACDYVFITKPGTDYIVKQEAEVLENAWTDIELSQPYTITGDELYVGVGRRGLVVTNFSNVETSAPDGLWHRTMGNDNSQAMTPGKWIYVPDQSVDFEHPIPLKFVISGDNMVTDVAIMDLNVAKSKDKENLFNVTLNLQNRSQEVVKSVVVEWDVDGSHQSTNTLETDLRPGRSLETGFSFETTFPDRYHKLNYKVTTINGKADALADNSTGTVSFVSSDMPIDDGVQRVNNVELKDGQLWWNNYDVVEMLNSEGENVNIIGKEMVGIRYHTATYIPYKLVGGQGTTVDGINFYRNTLAMQNVTLWVSTHLPKSEMDADVEILDIPNNQLATEIFKDHQVAFKQSHEIPEGGLYVGYSFDITADMMNAGYPLQCIRSELNREGAFWVRPSYQLNWEDLAATWGNLRVQVLFGGSNYNQNAVRAYEFNHASAVLNDKAQAELVLVNDGVSNVNSISYKVSGKNGVSYEKEATLSIPAFNKKTITLELDADPTPGYDEKTITITKVNGVTNTAQKDLSDIGTLFTLTKKPNVTAVIEEKTGTIYGNSPAGITIREKLKEMYGDKLLPIVIHHLDVMEIDDYHDVLTLSNCPVAYVNRKKAVDIYHGSKREYGAYWLSDPFGIDRDVQNALNAVVPGSVNVRAVWTDDEQNNIDICADTQFEMDADNLPFQLGFVLLEDGLSGTGSAWTQNNDFSGNYYYDDPMFEKWFNMPPKVEGLKYDYVPVAAWNPYKGVEGTIPTSVKAGQKNSYTFKADITGNSHIQDKSKLTAMVLLLDKNTGQIINAAKCMITEATTVSISSAKQVPYCSDKNLDFANINDLKAYVATGYDKTKGTIWLTRVNEVPANTGFLLMGDEGSYNIPIIEGVSNAYYKNMFKGTIDGETIYTTDGDYTNYYLSNGDYGVGFYKVGSSVALKANRAYLSIPTDIPAAGSEGDTELIKVGGALQVPYYTSKNLDFSTMEAQGVKAYTATGYNYKTGTIWLSRVKQVPAHTGVLVMAGEAGEYSVPTASVASVYENMFAGSETAQTIYDKETIDGVDYVNYYLSNGDYGVGFYRAKSEGVNLGVNRCYLQVPYRASASGARGESRDVAPVWCNMVLSDEGDDVIAIPVYGGTDGNGDGTTTIQSSIFNVQSSEVYYNLQGQRVDRPSKGLYIKNGKKVLIK